MKRKSILDSIAETARKIILILIGIVFFSVGIFILVIVILDWGSETDGITFAIVSGSLGVFFGILLIISSKSAFVDNPFQNNRRLERTFNYYNKENLIRKQMQTIVTLSAVYLIIVLSVFIPMMISYNEHWADGHSGARSPVGSGGEVCAVFLLILFVAIFYLFNSIYKHRLIKRFIEEYEIITREIDEVK